MDEITSKTIHDFQICQKFRPDLIVIHGDRIELLACAIVGSLNNILVAHIEGGEVSGTVDEMLRTLFLSCHIFILCQIMLQS